MSIARDPTAELFRTIAFSKTTLDLNAPGDFVTFKHEGLSTGTIQIHQTEGSSGTWVVTVEQSNDGQNWVARSPSQTYSSAGVQTGITLVTTYTRVIVTTAQGSDAKAVVSMSARI